jgi:two-component system, sensor histidine kinase PdtaS
LKGTLLHIEDNEDDQEILRERLTAPGIEFEIEFANCISSAIACLRRCNIDIILADLSLPDSAGTDTFSCLQSEAPNVPIVLLTGRSDEDLAARLLGMGAQDYLDKDSLTREALVRALRYAIERKRTEIALRAALEEQERIQEEIRRAEERFRLVVDAAPNAILMIGEDRNIALLNSQAQKLFGYDRQELVGKPADILIPERFIRSCDGNRRTAFDTPSGIGPEAGADLFGLRKDGREVPIEISLNSICTPEGSFILASIIDITDRKHSQDKLKRSLNEKQALLQEVHHRVKNNLQIISSLLSLQAGLVEDEEAAAKLLDSQHRVSSMAMIHERLYQHDDMSSIDLAEYVGDLAVRLFSSYAPSPSITYSLILDSTSLSIDQSIPCGMILNELITNALKYAYPDGAGEIVVRLFSAGKNVHMTVSDAGIGMPTAFDWRKSKSLGMTLVRQLTGQLDGTLELGTQPGTSFTVSFTKHSL